jgi:hypothetical protein
MRPSPKLPNALATSPRFRPQPIASPVIRHPPLDQLDSQAASTGPVLNPTPAGLASGSAHPAQPEGVFASFGDAFRWQRREHSDGRSLLVATEQHVTDRDVDEQLAHLERTDRAVGDAMARPQTLTVVVRQFAAPSFNGAHTLVIGLLKAEDASGLRAAPARENFGTARDEWAPVTADQRAELLGTGALTRQPPAAMCHEYGHGLFRASLERAGGRLGELALAYREVAELSGDAFLATYYQRIVAEGFRSGDLRDLGALTQKTIESTTRYSAKRAALTPDQEEALAIVGHEMSSHDELMADVVAVVAMGDLGALHACVGRHFDRTRATPSGQDSEYTFLDRFRFAIGDQLKPVLAEHDPAARKREAKKVLEAVLETLLAEGQAMTGDGARRPSQAWFSATGQLDPARLAAYNDRLIADFAQRCAG